MVSLLQNRTSERESNTSHTSTYLTSTQRVLNGLQRTRLSRRRMILFLPLPPPPSPVSKFDLRHTGRLRKRDKLVTGSQGIKGVGEEPNRTTTKKHGPLSKIQYSLLSEVSRLNIL
jgi:hypothetical protein